MARSQRVSAGVVRVVGMPELTKALKDAGPSWTKAARESNKDVAKIVAADAKAAATALGGVAAKTAPSVRASAGVASAGVAFGGAAYPFAGGAEFGALRYKQFQPWRGNGSDAGYFVYPTIRKDSDQIREHYRDSLDDMTRRLGLG